MKRIKSALCIALVLLIAAAAQADTAPFSVSYLGPEGTYTQEASVLFFGGSCDLKPQKTVSQAVEMLLGGECEYAVIPQENTIGGPVYDYVDELLAHEGLYIAGEVELPIRQALLAPAGVSPETITTVYSHPQGIEQSRIWLAENLPDAELIEVSSTAEGAKMAAQSESLCCAAIASAGAAQVYGLQVLAEGIQLSEANKTRFYILTDLGAQKEADDRMVFTAAGRAEGLPALLGAAEEAGLRIVSLHDRPEKTELGRYVYLIECEEAGYEQFEAVSKTEGFDFRYYGAFPLR